MEMVSRAARRNVTQVLGGTTMIYDQKETSIEEIIKDFKKIYSKIRKGDAQFFDGYSKDDMTRLDNMLMVFDDNIHVSKIKNDKYVIETTLRSNNGLTEGGENVHKNKRKNNKHG